MKKMNKVNANLLKVIGSLFFILAPIHAHAQFNTTGDDPARVKWSTFKSNHYRIVFPRGMDSLAYVYAENLEKFHTPVAWTAGFAPGEKHKSKIPAILHPYSGESNASVTWAPKRMDFYMIPDAYDPDPINWEKHVTIHESRHVAQMQLGYDGIFKPFPWFLGDIFVGAVAGLYGNKDLMEGDAVVAETALTNSGRGRSGDFLNYYMSAFNTGDFRNWYKWKHGSWRHYYPNHYALGYLVLAGTRVFYDYPMYMDEYYSRISSNPLRLGTFKRNVSVASGMKYDDAFMDIVQNYMDIWNTSAQQRGPFIKSEFVTKVPNWFEEYSGATFVGDDILVKKSGLLTPTTLVRLSPDGSEKNIRQFSMNSSKLVHDENTGRVYWTETIGNARWSLAAKSKVRYIETDGNGRRIHTLTNKGRLYNPAPSPDGKRLAVVDYPYDGGSALVILDSETGAEIERFKAPGYLHLADLVWTKDGKLVLSGITEAGAGLYMYDGFFKEVLAPQPRKINSLRADGNDVIFTSDRTGVNEIYRLSDNEIFQLTSTQYGAKDGVIHNGDLYFTTLETGLGEGNKVGEGRLIRKADASSLMSRKVDYSQLYHDPVADALSAQEREIGGNVEDYENVEVEFSGVKPYRKLPHIPRIHSWAPIRITYNNFSSINMDVISALAGLGATVFFQNDHGTAYGSVAYGYSPGAQKGYKNTGHFMFTYTGLLPVIELSANIGGSPAGVYSRAEYQMTPNEKIEGVYYDYRNAPKMDATVDVYLPLSTYSGGWIKGITPRFYYSVSNDIYNRSVARFSNLSALEGGSYMDFKGYDEEESFFVQNMRASLTAYYMQNTPKALEYPRWGIGVEGGYNGRVGLSDIYGSGVYGYTYGYVPGIMRQHGVKLTATYQHIFNSLYATNYVKMTPRGFVDGPVSSYLAGDSRNQLKLTVDYSIPFKMEFGYNAVFRVTHFVIKPHFDCTLFSEDSLGETALNSAALASVGSEFAFKLANFLWLPFDATAGLVVDYNGTSGIDALDLDYSKFHLGVIFKIDL